MAQQTPLYEQHTLCGARMVDFHGWMMPLHYGSQIDEHHAVRTDAGMFDVSHMTIVDLRGSRTREFQHSAGERWRSSPKAAKPFYSMLECLWRIDYLIVYYLILKIFRLLCNPPPAKRPPDYPTR